jgi:hypothetical protein
MNARSFSSAVFICSSALLRVSRAFRVGTITSSCIPMSPASLQLWRVGPSRESTLLFKLEVDLEICNRSADHRPTGRSTEGSDFGSANGIRTRVTAVRGRRPEPLDDSAREFINLSVLQKFRQSAQPTIHLSDFTASIRHMPMISRARSHQQYNFQGGFPLG